MEEEQVYTIPLRDAKKIERYKRANEAVKLVKDYLKKHSKAKEVKISPDLNRKIWEKGAENPPSRIRIRAIKLDEETVEANSLE